MFGIAAFVIFHFTYSVVSVVIGLSKSNAVFKSLSLYQPPNMYPLFRLGATAIGVSRTQHLVSTVMPDNTQRWLAAPHNLSLLAIPLRWLAHSFWNNPAVNLPSLGNALALVAGAVCIIAAFRTPARLSGDIFWAAVPWMLLISPILWYEYLVLALPYIYLIVRNYVVDRKLPPWFVLIGVALVMAWTFDVVPTRNESMAVLLGVLALPTYGLVMLGLSEWTRPRVGTALTSGDSFPSLKIDGSSKANNAPQKGE